MLVAVGDERVGRERKERERENHQRRKAENELFFFFLFFTKQRVGTCSFRFFSEEGEDSSVTSFLPLFLIFDGELLIYSFLMVRVWGKGDGTERNGRGAKRERERERERKETAVGPNWPTLCSRRNRFTFKRGSPSLRVLFSRLGCCSRA